MMGLSLWGCFLGWVLDGLERLQLCGCGFGMGWCVVVMIWVYQLGDVEITMSGRSMIYVGMMVMGFVWCFLNDFAVKCMVEALFNVWCCRNDDLGDGKELKEIFTVIEFGVLGWGG